MPTCWISRGTDRVRLCLLLALLAWQHPAAAQALDTQDWNAWNRASPMVFPGAEWLRYTTPEAAGWSAERLEAVGQIIEDAESSAVMVIYNGAILAEWGATRRRFMCHSMRKSLLSALYGVAVGDGTIDINETLGSLGIDDLSPLSEIEKSASVADLLKARSGVYHPAAYWDPTNTPERGSHRPGRHWYYNNWDSNALGTIYNRNSGADLFEAFASRIARPLGMQDFALRHAYYHYEADTSRHPAYPFRMSTRDLARFGLLFLNDGQWRDRQIVPSRWVWESTRAHSAHRSGGYGYMWWTAREGSRLGQLGAYWAAGYGGHRVFVVPGAGLVLVHRADTFADNLVNDIYSRTILLNVLAARTGPPQSSPRLIRAIEGRAAITRAGIVPVAQRATLVGDYRGTRFDLSVREVDGRLELVSPFHGRYYLHSRSASQFEIEDARIPLDLAFDSDGRVSAIRVQLPFTELESFYRQRPEDASDSHFQENRTR